MRDNRIQLMDTTLRDGEQTQGVSFSPGFKIGTSNEGLQSKVKIELSGSGMIIILPIKSFNKIVKFAN